MKNIKNSGWKSPEVIFGCALALSGFSLQAQAADNPGSRYGCISKAAGRYFTDGATALEEYPCRVDPAAISSLTRAANADKKTDQINYDYLWSQEYYTSDNALTEVRTMGALRGKGGRSITFTYPELCQRGSLEASNALARIKEALAFEAEPDKAEVSGHIYATCEPFDDAHYPNAAVSRSSENKEQILLYTSTPNNSKRTFMGAVTWTPVITVPPDLQGPFEEAVSSIPAAPDQYKVLTDSFFQDAARKNKKPAKRYKAAPVAGIGIEGTLPVLSLGRRGKNWSGTVFGGLGSIKQKIGLYKFNSDVERIGFEFARNTVAEWSLLGGLRYDYINEAFNGLQLVNGTLTTLSGKESVNILYATLGAGYKLSEIVTLDARIIIPFSSKRSPHGNKYGKSAVGASIVVKLI